MSSCFKKRSKHLTFFNKKKETGRKKLHFFRLAAERPSRVRVRVHYARVRAGA